MSLDFSQYVFLRKLGIHNDSFKNQIQDLRFGNITNSKQSFESKFAGPICNKTWVDILNGAMDIERIEGKFLMCGSADGQISIYDILQTHPDLNTKLTPALVSIKKGDDDNHTGMVSSLHWYPGDNGLFFSGGVDRIVKGWDTNRKKVVIDFDVQDPVHCIAVSHLSHFPLIAVASKDQKIRILDIRRKNSAQALIGHREAPLALQWFPNDEHFLASAGLDRAIKLWDVRRAGCVFTLDQSGPPKTSTHLLQSSSDITTKICAHDAQITSLGFTPDGKYLLSSGRDRQIRKWSLLDGFTNTHTHFAQVKNNFHQHHQMGLSFNSHFVMHPNEKELGLYSIASGELVATLSGHLDRVNCVVAHPFLEAFYSAGNDRSILAWVPKHSDDERDEVDYDEWDDEEL